MIKSGLIARVSEQYPHLRPGAVEAVVDAMLARIAEALAADDRVELRGLGVFSAIARAPRPGRNLASGKPILVGEKRIVSFRASRTIAAQLCGSTAPVSLRTRGPVVRLTLQTSCDADRARAAARTPLAVRGPVAWRVAPARTSGA